MQLLTHSRDPMAPGRLIGIPKDAIESNVIKSFLNF